MALIVRLIDDIKTETVIKLITVRRIRVMAGPDRIDVVLFHYLQIFFDLCKADCKSRHRIAVVAVCSVEFDLHAVQVQHTVLRVDLTDADMISDHLTRRLQHQRIQIRLSTDVHLLHASEPYRRQTLPLPQDDFLYQTALPFLPAVPRHSR